MDNNQKYGLYFSGDEDESKEDIFDAIMRVLEKNNLKESFGNAFEKKSQGKTSGIEFLYVAVKNLALERLTEKGFLLAAQKQLGISPEAAENLNKDVKLMLLPLAVKVKLGQKKEAGDTMPKMRAPIEVEKILAGKQGQPLKGKTKEPPIKKPPAKGPAMPMENEKPAVRQPRKPDSYREPIE